MADWNAAAAGGVIALLGRIVFDWFMPKRANGNSSGDKSPEYWELKFREAIRDVLDERKELMINATKVLNDKLDEVLRRMDGRRR